MSAPGDQLSFEAAGEALAEAPAAAAGAPAAARRQRPAPTPEQREAIEARRGDAFLEAGAGTGKTAVLVDRYCAAVADDGVEVDRILAFTFTERAAAEMRTRVRRELVARARAARSAGDRERFDELIRAARASERSWVMTIHAFCRRLLGAHPLAAGLDPRFRVLDAGEAARLRDRAAEAALDELLAGGDQAVAWAAAAYAPWRITEMTVAAYGLLRSQGMSQPRLPPVPEPAHSPKRDEEPRGLTAEELRAAGRAREAVERLLEGLTRRYAALKEGRSAVDFQDLELRAVELLRDSPALGAEWRERFTHVMVDEFQDTNRVQLELVEALRGEDTRIFRVGDAHQSVYRFRNADLEVFRAERRRAGAAPGDRVLPLRGSFRSLPAVLACVNAVGRALLDGFGELTAARPFTDPGAGSAELLLTLDEGRGAAARSWSADGIDLDPPAGGSSPRVVAEARLLAQRLRELVDAGEAERGEIVVLLRAFTHVDAYEEALQRAGLSPFVVGGRGYWTQQQVEDTVRLLGVVSNPLDDEHLLGALACFAVGVSPDALWLLRRAASDEDGGPRHLWPLIEWRFGDGAEPAACSPRWLEEIADRDAARLRRFCALLRELRAEAPLLGLEDLIERTMSSFGYDLGLIAREGGAGRMANVRKLMRLAREYEANEGRDLAGFLALAAESTRRDEREGMAAVQAEGHDGVRVMTVHAAKGLEFGVVAVPDLGRALGAGHSHADLVIGPPPDEGDGQRRFGMRLASAAGPSLGLWELVELNTLEAEAAAEEGCRLVYVAASRARDRLILSGCFRPSELEPVEEPKPGDSPIRRLLPELARLGWDGGEGEVGLPGPRTLGGSEPLPETALTVRISEPGAEQATRLARRHPPPERAEPGTAATTPPLLDPRAAPVPVGHLSYSALALYERCGYRFYVERVLGAGNGELEGRAAGRSQALATGNVVHAALEWCARHDWREPPRELLDALLTREGIVGGEAAERAERLVGGWLASPLLAELGATAARPEVPFVLTIGDAVVRGQIDLLAESGDAMPTVVDYKTDALDGREPAELADRYRAQREVYALAAANGEAVRVAHVFLEAPDRPVVETLAGDRLERARGRLGEVIASMRAGSFEVAADPDPPLCFGCPAARRLCPRPQWRPGRR